MEEAQQLSLEVGGDRPEVATLKLTGALAIAQELAMGAEVLVRVVGLDGELIAEAEGAVMSVQFRRHEPAPPSRAWTGREHTVALR